VVVIPIRAPTRVMTKLQTQSLEVLRVIDSPLVLGLGNCHAASISRLDAIILRD
jgi:hypothetical protein